MAEFIVTIERTVVHRADITIEAKSYDHAEKLVTQFVDDFTIEEMCKPEWELDDEVYEVTEVNDA